MARIFISYRKADSREYAVRLNDRLAHDFGQNEGRWTTQIASFTLDSCGVTAPVCDANGPYVAECGVSTSLDGSASLDPDGGALTFSWTGPFTPSPTSGSMPLVTFPEPIGAKIISLLVTDPDALTDSCTAEVTVQDTLAPSLTAPADVTEECTSPAGTPVVLGTPIVNDVCDTSLDIANDAPALFPLGMTTVNWTATDDAGNTDTATQTVTVVDTTPPDFELSVSPEILRPPNHKLVTINAQITVLPDVCNPDPTITLVSIISNEPDNGKGDGNTVNDIQDAAFGTDDREFKLRSERSGRGSGRVYTITYEAEGTANEVTVTVPHDRRP